jgi:hypothetical protein
MKVILSVPDEGYSRNSSCALDLIKEYFFAKKQGYRPVQQDDNSL